MGRSLFWWQQGRAQGVVLGSSHGSYHSWPSALLSSPGVNLLVGTENGLMLLDRSGQGKVYNLINRRRFQQMDVLEGLNVLVTISGAPLLLSPRHSPARPCTSPEWLQLRQNLLAGVRGELPGELDMVYSGIKSV